MSTTLQHLAGEIMDFNAWANEQIGTFVSDEYFEQPLNSSFSGIKPTLAHIWDAQAVWLQRLRNDESLPLPGISFSGTREEFFKGLVSHAQELADFVKNQEASFFDEMLHYTNLQGKQFSQPKYQIITQLSHHGQLHRGQVLSMMRILGYTGKIPQIDIIAWYRIRQTQA